MPDQITQRRTNLFAVLLWVVAILLIGIGLVLRQTSLSAYAQAYVDSATATDAAQFYDSVFGSQYTIELGNGLLVAGSIAVMIALFFHGLTALLRNDPAAGAKTELTAAGIAALLEDDESEGLDDDKKNEESEDETSDSVVAAEDDEASDATDQTDAAASTEAPVAEAASEVAEDEEQR